MSTPPGNDSSQQNNRPWASALAFIIGVGALIAFILLNRKMAPPFPNFGTNSVQQAASTNAPAQK